MADDDKKAAEAAEKAQKEKFFAWLDEWAELREKTRTKPESKPSGGLLGGLFG